jgi:membrane fusion protein (multidrug efflux system)
MSEFVEEEFIGPAWPEAAFTDDGNGAADPMEAPPIVTIEPTHARAPASKPARGLRPARAPDEAEIEPGLEPAAEAPKAKRGRRLAALVAGLLAAAALAGSGYVYWDGASRFGSTDDAFIAARQFVVAAKASGYVAEVPVVDNQHVDAGDLIARIDDRDYRAALAAADAQVAAARANIDNVEAQIAVQQAQIDQNQAQVEATEAALAFAEQQATRYEDLAQRGAGSVQNAEQYSSGLRQQQAAVKTAKAALATAQRQTAALDAQRASAEAALAQANAQRDQAELNLSYTRVTATQSGRVVNLSAAVGQFAATGTGLSMFVPDEVWVVANFKETQLDAMRPGQPATIAIDAYPERVLHGHVASVQPGSGTAFSLLPAENATGNYVKVVQRVPVKIVLDDPPTDVALGPGMSVVPSVRVDSTPSLYERLRSWL